MPPTPQKDIITRLADAGEDAIHRLSDLPGASRFVDTANSMRSRMDELQKKVRGIDALEQRIATLEKRVDALSKAPAKPRAARSTTAKKKTPPVAP